MKIQAIYTLAFDAVRNSWIIDFHWLSHRSDTFLGDRSFAFFHLYARNKELCRCGVDGWCGRNDGFGWMTKLERIESFKLILQNENQYAEPFCRYILFLSKKYKSLYSISIIFELSSAKPPPPRLLSGCSNCDVRFVSRIWIIYLSPPAANAKIPSYLVHVTQ